MSDTSNNEDAIRKRAYALWEQDGRPEGRAEEYWHRARMTQDDAANAGDPAPSEEPATPEASANAEPLPRALAASARPGKQRQQRT